MLPEKCVKLVRSQHVWSRSGSRARGSRRAGDAAASCFVPLGVWQGNAAGSRAPARGAWAGDAQSPSAPFPPFFGCSSEVRAQKSRQCVRGRGWDKCRQMWFRFSDGNLWLCVCRRQRAGVVALPAAGTCGARSVHLSTETGPGEKEESTMWFLIILWAMWISSALRFPLCTD